MEHPKIRGNESEAHAARLFNYKGLDWKQVDITHDFEVNGRKVEVKSCALCIWNGVRHRPNGKHDDKPHLRFGRFQFNQDSPKLYDDDADILFMISHDDQYLMLGVIPSKELWESREDADKTRYIALSSPRLRNLKKFDEWVEKLKTETEYETKTK